jgi:acyl dehydratase
MRASRDIEGEVVAVAREGDTVHIAVGIRRERQPAPLPAGETGNAVTATILTSVVSLVNVLRRLPQRAHAAAWEEDVVAALSLDEESYELLGPVAVGDTVRISVSRGRVEILFSGRERGNAA